VIIICDYLSVEWFYTVQCLKINWVLSRNRFLRGERKDAAEKTGGGQNSYNNLPRFKLGGRVITGLFFCAGQTRDTVGQAFDNKTIRKVAQRRRGTAKIVIDLPTIVEYGCTAWPGNPPTTWFF
jgi:hypothetical protein